jgi:glutamate-1-semialdehyde 2,1-aminomutase
LYRRAKAIFAGGTQLLSKRPELFAPKQWPPYCSKASRRAVWDLDCNGVLDMTYRGIGACILGYADPTVNEVVKKVIDAGSMKGCPLHVLFGVDAGGQWAYTKRASSSPQRSNV